jgi:hypothetical protein
MGIGEESVPPNSSNTSLDLGSWASGDWARLRTYSRVGIPYLMIDWRLVFFCWRRLQQNQRRTERIERATTPLTDPAMIGTTGLLEEDFPTGFGEDVAEVDELATKVVCVEVGVTTVEMTEEIDDGTGDTVTVAIVVGTEFEDGKVDDAPFGDTEPVWA